jgi:hypothetical protein
MFSDTPKALLKHYYKNSIFRFSESPAKSKFFRAGTGERAL